MSNLHEQIKNMTTLIENIVPYSHNQETSFDKPYQHVSIASLENDLMENSFRHFNISLEQSTPLAISSLSSNSFEVNLEISVLYPFANQSEICIEYFAEENKLFAELLENPSNYANQNVRLVNLESSEIKEIDTNRLMFVHTFYMIIDESLS